MDLHPPFLKNNHIENLEMLTVKQNAKHSAIAGRYKRHGESNNNCKYSDEKILTALTYLDLGLTCKEVGNLVGLKRKYVNDLRLGKIRCKM